jgi:hypothetical protein
MTLVPLGAYAWNEPIAHAVARAIIFRRALWL